jgi:AmmeMemoRadiSam system protein B
VAGRFYPDSPSNLKAMINGFLANEEKQVINAKLVALIVPHAGYVFSGQVAASAYKQIEGMHFDTVVLVGVSHGVDFKGASVYRSGKYETPLGIVEIDEYLAEELMARSDFFSFQPIAHNEEHSVEVQIPFLQQILLDFKIVPILVRDWSEIVSSAISDILAETISGKNILLIASSDMSHYPPYDEAVKADKVTISALETMNSGVVRERLDEYLRRGVRGLDCMLCGRGAVLVVMAAAKKLGAGNIKILKYANSGDAPMGDKRGVVGYFAAAVYQSKSMDL